MPPGGYVDTVDLSQLDAGNQSLQNVKRILQEQDIEADSEDPGLLPEFYRSIFDKWNSYVNKVPLSALDEDNLNLQNAMRILKEDPESLLAFKHTIKDKIELLLKQLYPGEELYKAFAQVTKIHPDILGE